MIRSSMTYQTPLLPQFWGRLTDSIAREHLHNVRHKGYTWAMLELVPPHGELPSSPRSIALCMAKLVGRWC